MREKYYIRDPDSDAIIGLRYDPIEKELKAGGPRIYIDWFKIVLERFYVDVDNLTWDINVNRATVILYVGNEEWYLGLVNCEHAGYEMEEIRSFRRFMG